MKKIFVPLMLSVACALILTACGGSDSNNSTTTNKTATSNTTGPGTTTTTTTTTAGKTGVAECDDYLAKLEACLAKLPAAARDSYNKSYEQNKQAWQQAASTAEGRAALAQNCKAATDAVRQPMKNFGCDF